MSVLPGDASPVADRIAIVSSASGGLPRRSSRSMVGSDPCSAAVDGALASPL